MFFSADTKCFSLYNIYIYDEALILLPLFSDRWFHLPHPVRAIRIKKATQWPGLTIDIKIKHHAGDMSACHAYTVTTRDARLLLRLAVDTTRNGPCSARGLRLEGSRATCRSCPVPDSRGGSGVDLRHEPWEREWRRVPPVLEEEEGWRLRLGEVSSETRGWREPC